MRQVDLDVQELRRALDLNGSLVAVHYACESFMTAKDRPAGVACIALHDLQTHETLAFSRADAPSSLDGDNREIQLLRRFFAELESRTDAFFLHWNMNRPEYSFAALSARYEYLTGEAPEGLAPSRRIDVDELLSARFGSDYAPHGRLESMGRLNNQDLRSFKSGKSEAEIFAKGDWGTLTRSASSKAVLIANLARALAEGRIRTAGTAGTLVFAGCHLDAVAVVLELGDRMLPVQRSLKVRSHGKPLTFANEYDDQYLYRALLVQFFADVRDEEFVPSYAGGNSRIDFLLPDFELAIELKHTRAGLTDKALGEQLVVDRDRYANHSSATHLICLVFDHDGNLRNPRALEQDLRRDVSTERLAVTVRIYDR